MERIKAVSKKSGQINAVLDRKIRELDSLRDWIGQLKEIIRESADVIEKQNNSILQLETEIENLQTILQDKQSESENLKQKLQYFEKKYSVMDEVYKKYVSLDDKTKNDLKGIFGNADTVTQFFSAAVQETHLDKYWDYLNYEINNHNFEAVVEKDLKDIFDFCFDCVNISQREPLYKRLTVNIGDKFDGKRMIKTSDSNQLGNVSAVKLQGYQYIISGKMVKPSLVVLKNL